MESHRKILVLSCIRNEVFDEKPVRVSANSNRFVRLHFLGTAQQDQVLLVEAVAPVYPMVAVYSSTKGEVMVKLTIDKTGAVSGAKVIQGHRLLAVSAEEAARKWRFTAGSGDTQIAVAFVFRILPKGPPDAELATRFRTPYQMEIRRVIPDASTNSDPASDPPRRKAK